MHITGTTRLNLHQIFRVYYLLQWLGLPLAAFVIFWFRPGSFVLA